MKPQTVELGYIASNANDRTLNDNPNFVEFYNPEDAAKMQVALEYAKMEFKVVTKHYEEATHSPSGQMAIRFFVTPDQNALKQGWELQRLFEFVKDMIKSGDKGISYQVELLSEQFEKVFIN